MQPDAPNDQDQLAHNRDSRSWSPRLWQNLAIVAATILVAILLLLTTTNARIADLKAQDNRLASLAVAGTAKEIENTVFNTRRMLNLFAENEAQLLARIADNPTDESLFAILQDRVRHTFPNAFAVTIANRHGEPYIVDFSGLVEEICRKDIRAFAQAQTPPPIFIHPNPEGYHVDLMVRLQAGSEPVIFFVSFRPTLFTRSLATRSIPHHELLMINAEREGLIEITAEGSRDRLSRNFFLSEQELTAITHGRHIAGTQWRLVAMPLPNVVAEVYRPIWATAALVSVILFLVGTFAIFQLVRSDQRTRVQNKLLRAVSRAESRFIAEGDVRGVFETVLDDLMALTASEHGFIGEILHDGDEKPFLRTYAITDVSWDEETARRYDSEMDKGLEFHNLDNLFGSVVRTGEEVVSNDPTTDNRTVGLPEGHHPIHTFIGIPLYHGPHFVGMIGLANRHDGYDKSTRELITPITRSTANLLWALKSDRQKQVVDNALRESNTRQQAILNTVFDGIITLNEKGLIESFNPAAERMFGYEASRILGCDLLALLDNIDQQSEASALFADLKIHADGASSRLQEATGRRQDGTIFPVEISISETPIEGRRLYTCIVRDITRRKQAQQALIETTSLQRAILDSANYSIISTDADGVIRTFNAGAARMLGYAPDEVVGRHTPALIHDHHEVTERARELSEELGHHVEPGFESFVAKARNGAIDEREWTYIRKDGTRFPVLLSITALHDDTGRLTGFLGVGSDITERRKIDRMKREFVSTVSHELRTPLTAIRGALGLIAGGMTGELSKRARELVEVAANNSDRLVRIINDILDIEKIEAGSMDFRFERQPILPIIQRSVAANAGYAEQAGIRLDLEAASDIIVYVDGDRLNQVVDNLLSNAIKFSPPGSVVDIHVLPTADGVRVSVRDQGAGIPEDFQPRLFSKFAQADGSDSRQRGGTGLGLAISRSIIDRHRGTMGYRSEQGKGSEFYFDLPRAGDSPLHDDTSQ